MAFGPEEALPLASAALKGLLGKSNADQLQEHAAALANRGGQTQLADIAARLPLRGMAIDRILAPQPGREDLNGIFSDPGNPYNRPLDRPVAMLPDLPPANLPQGNTAGMQYAEDVRHRGALPTGNPGDFRTHALENQANYHGVFSPVIDQQGARDRIAALARTKAAQPSGGYYS